MALNINDLSVEQLAELRKSMEAEVEHLGDSFTKLREAQAKFNECAQSVQSTSVPSNDGKDLLVPLTSSLYVPGKIRNTDKFVVDVGTDYFVEKNAADAKKFFENKVATLNKNLVDLDKLVNEKVATLKALENAFITKARAAQLEQQTAAQAKAQSKQKTSA